ncbi:MAG TPA: M14 family metallopeptidase [Candidatus Paceibacterota bacterium]
MKKIIIVFVVIILVGFGAYFLIQWWGANNVAVTPDITKPPTDKQASGTPVVAENKSETVIGKSVQGRDITAYHFGTGDTKVLFVGGIHGGYEWNTTLVAYEMMDYLKANLIAIPKNVQVTVIPVLNPDGLNKVLGTAGRFSTADVTASQAVQVSGRYNANMVDLNRNFDCDWQTTGKWQSKTVSGGSVAFSEPESLAIKNYVEAENPAAVVVFFSAAGGIFSSSCNGGVLPETSTITNLYAKAAGYPAYKSFDFYETTGDMTNWLAKINIPAISVILTTHTDTEWSKNQAGIMAIIQNYAK